jgi:hypothetical protein
VIAHHDKKLIPQRYKINALNYYGVKLHYHDSDNVDYIDNPNPACAIFLEVEPRREMLNFFNRITALVNADKLDCVLGMKIARKFENVSIQQYENVMFGNNYYSGPDDYSFEAVLFDIWENIERDHDNQTKEALLKLLTKKQKSALSLKKLLA